jgi:hypothetical protein
MNQPISPHHVCPHCHRSFTPYQGKNYDHLFTPEIIKMYQDGEPILKIAAKAGIAQLTLRQQLMIRGYKPRKRGRPLGKISETSQQRRKAIGALYSQGETLDAIGKKFGVTRERVRQIITYLGLEPRMPAMIEKAKGNALEAVEKRLEKAIEREEAVEAASELWTSGGDVRAVAELIGWNAKTVQHATNAIHFLRKKYGPARFPFRRK